MELLTPTGGLRWHLRAFLRRRRLWEEFRRNLEGVLDSWSTRGNRTLVLIASSGGYTLPESLLRRFDTIIALDREPFALFVFRMRWRLRVPGRIFTRRMDALGIEPGRPVDSAVLARVLGEYPDAAVLFCNVLGQVRFVLDDADEREDLTRWRTEVRELLAVRKAPWASFHERWSGESKPARDLWLFGGDGRQPASLEELFPDGGELLDHLTADVVPSVDRRAWLRWPFDSSTWHLVEVSGGPWVHSEI